MSRTMDLPREARASPACPARAQASCCLFVKGEKKNHLGLVKQGLRSKNNDCKRYMSLSTSAPCCLFSTHVPALPDNAPLCVEEDQADDALFLSSSSSLPSSF